MESFDPSNCRLRYSVLPASPLGEQNYYGQELNIDVKYQFLESTRENPIPKSDPSISRWVLQITGKPSTDFREELIQRLNDESIPSAIQNEVVPCIFDNITSCEAFGLRAIISLHIFDHEDEDEEDISEEEEEIDEELDMVMELSMEDSSKPTSASREVVEALEKVMIKGEEKEPRCVVCLEEFELGFEATKMPCSHVFHGDCIGRWLENRYVCPLCRYELSSAEETTLGDIKSCGS